MNDCSLGTGPDVAAGAGASVASLPTYDISDVYVAGLSSGGYMATQLHVAHSAKFSGAAVFAGGPYYCAQGDLFRALYACMDTFMDRQLSQLQDRTVDWAGQGLIDPVANLAGDPVYVFHGTADNTVQRPVSDDLVAYYEHFGADVAYQDSTGAGHAWVSPLGPNPCASTAAPYVNDCGIDPQQALLSALFGSVQPPSTGGRTGTMVEFDQDAYAVGGSAEALSMDRTGYAYVPTSCADGATCRLVIALHGCLQTRSAVGTAFVDNAYLNEYADTNDVIVLYPQAAPDALVGNPRGCWDWWGYLGETNYAQQGGSQITTIMRMVAALGG